MSSYAWEEQLEIFLREKNWKEIIDLGSKLAVEEKCRYLWVWPTIDNLNFLRRNLNKLQIDGVLSIGCGSGLLEWIIQQSLGINTAGIELDRIWWSSKHSPKVLISLHFIDEKVTGTFLQQCFPNENWNFALLFCYFNNRSAFLDYIKAYKGKCVIIIGPSSEKGTHTDPSPFEPLFYPSNTWFLSSFQEVGSTKDYIAVYIRNDL